MNNASIPSWDEKISTKGKIVSIRRLRTGEFQGTVQESNKSHIHLGGKLDWGYRRYHFLIKRIEDIQGLEKCLEDDVQVRLVLFRKGGETRLVFWKRLKPILSERPSSISSKGSVNQKA